MLSPFIGETFKYYYINQVMDRTRKNKKETSHEVFPRGDCVSFFSPLRLTSSAGIFSYLELYCWDMASPSGIRIYPTDSEMTSWSRE